MDSTKSQQNVAVHTISFRGKAGAIFVLLCFTITLFVVGFATNHWSRKDGVSYGLFANCTCDFHDFSGENQWLIGVVTLIGAGLLCLLICLLLISIYMCVHTVSKNSTIIALVFFCFFAFIFTVAGFVFYAVQKTLHEAEVFWSFGLVVSSSFFCLVAAIVSLVQLKSSGVRL